MEYSKLVAVTGLPGLFELINSKTDGAIVRSLDDKSTRFISSRVHQFSQLESIEVYTVRDNVNLVDIFTAMDKDGGKLPDEKDAGAIKKYFEKVYPDMDFERVYNSDMKKMVKWFAILKKNDVEIKLTEIPEEEPAEEPVVEEKPAKKKAAPKEEKEEAPKKKTVAKEEAPKKKAEEKPAAKKKAAAKEETPKKKAAAKDKEKDDKPKKKAAPKKK
jgi:hypothetical protein